MSRSDVVVESLDRGAWSRVRAELIAQLYADTPLRPAADDPPDDAELLVARRQEEVLACAALLHTPGIALDDAPTLLMGWFECVEERGVAEALVTHARHHAASLGLRRLLGPINGDTWHSYRVALPSAHPPFFLDLSSRPWYAAALEGAGGEVVASYHSTALPPRSVATLENERQRLQEEGVVVREIVMESFDAELERIHTLSVAAFVDNPFYTPLDLSRFLELYQPLRGVVDPRFVLMAERNNHPVGFVFAVEDRFAGPGERMVMKSAATAEEVRGTGLGSLLMAMIHHHARERGYQRVIHALMHDSNRSARILAGGAEVIRRYHLYGWRA